MPPKSVSYFTSLAHFHVDLVTVLLPVARAGENSFYFDLQCRRKSEHSLDIHLFHKIQIC